MNSAHTEVTELADGVRITVVNDILRDLVYADDRYEHSTLRSERRCHEVALQYRASGWVQAHTPGRWRRA
jgi:hypothetical protein